MLFFSSNQQIAMPKTSGIPKSILADIKKLKTSLATLEKNHNTLFKDFKSTIKSHSEMLKKQQSTIAQQESTIAQLGKKSVKKEKAPHRPALQCDKQARTGSHRHNNTNHSTTIRRSDARMHQSIPSINPFFLEKVVRKNSRA